MAMEPVGWYLGGSESGPCLVVAASSRPELLQRLPGTSGLGFRVQGFGSLFHV